MSDDEKKQLNFVVREGIEILEQTKDVIEKTNFKEDVSAEISTSNFQLILEIKRMAGD